MEELCQFRRDQGVVSMPRKTKSPAICRINDPRDHQPRSLGRLQTSLTAMAVESQFDGMSTS